MKDLPENIQSIPGDKVLKVATNYGGRYSDPDLRDEFRKLVDMHGEIPENVVEPREWIGEGYEMEELDIDFMLHEPSEETSDELLRNLTHDLIENVAHLHQTRPRIYHGELYHNVAVVSEGSVTKPVMIDPAGKSHDRYEKRYQRNSDFKDIQSLAKMHLGSLEPVSEHFDSSHYERYSRPSALALD